MHRVEKNQKINKRTGPNHYYTVLPNKSAQGGFFFQKDKRACSFIRQTRVVASMVCWLKATNEPCKNTRMNGEKVVGKYVPHQFHLLMGAQHVKTK